MILLKLSDEFFWCFFFHKLHLMYNDLADMNQIPWFIFLQDLSIKFITFSDRASRFFPWLMQNNIFIKKLFFAMTLEIISVYHLLGQAHSKLKNVVKKMEDTKYKVHQHNFIRLFLRHSFHFIHINKITFALKRS